MGREETGYSHPKINESEGNGHPSQVKAVLSQGMVNLKCNIKSHIF
jgi:hypothetical protein